MYQIDAEQFLEISGLPDFSALQLEQSVRPGIDGTGFWETGKRGMPCTIRTKVDAENAAYAIDAYQRYCALIEEPPVSLIFLGVSLDAYNVKFQVLRVRPIFVGAIAGGVGGLNPPSLGWCECEWELCPVPIA